MPRIEYMLRKDLRRFSECSPPADLLALHHWEVKAKAESETAWFQHTQNTSAKAWRFWGGGWGVGSRVLRKCVESLVTTKLTEHRASMATPHKEYKL